MYVTYEIRMKMLGRSAHRDELILLWQCLRRLPSMNQLQGKTRLRRANPRYILDVQSIKHVDEFRSWATQRNWKPGYVPVLENPSVVPDTELDFKYESYFEKGKLYFEKNMSPIHRTSGAVPDYLWVTNFEVRFISIQALHRRKGLPQDLPNYSLQRLRKYRQNSRRHQQGTTIFGETKSLRQWALDSRCGVSLSTLTKRVNSGIDPEVALTK